jgi:hypothetical protein
MSTTPVSIQETESVKLPVELDAHYTVAQVARAWNTSQDTVRRCFENLPGVIRICRPETKSKRKYTTLRIPARVLRSMHSRLGLPEVA